MAKEGSGFGEFRRIPRSLLRGASLNRFVRFKVSDVTIPGPQDVVNDLYGRDIVQGKVVDITENGALEQAFIIVKLEGMKLSSFFPQKRRLESPISE